MTLAHNVQYYALVGTAAIMRVLPRSWALFCADCLGWVGWRSGMRRELVLSNLRQALPEANEAALEKIAAQAARNFARSAIEFTRIDGRDRANLDVLVSVDGVEMLKGATGEGKGCLVLTAHLGAWALYFAALAVKGIPMSLLVGKQHNEKIDDFIHGISGREGHLIPKGRAAVKHILQALGRGDCVVMVADQHAGEYGILSPFLGRLAPTLSLPGAFVARNGIPVFTLTGHRVARGRHEVEIRPLPIEEHADKEALKQEVTDRYNEAIGEAVRKHPEQYLWYHRRWRDTDTAPIDKS